MDPQKHDILFSDVDACKSFSLRKQDRNAAYAGMGLPIEVPPSYDDSMKPRAPGSPIDASRKAARHFQAALPIIIEQPDETGQYYGRLNPNYTGPHPSPSAYSFQPMTLPPQPKLGPSPCYISCPACGANNITQMTYTPNARTHFCAIALCVLGWCCFACFLPYWMKSCRTGNHYCMECQTFLGSYFPHNE